MSFVKFVKNEINILLVALFSLFFLAPALEESRFVIITSPFAFLVVLILSIRAVSLRLKDFWQMVLFAAIGFFLDLILTFTTEPVLEGMLTIVVRIVYLFILAFVLFLLLKRLLTSTTDSPTASFKVGLCGYLLIGFSWAILYSLIYAIDSGALSTKESAQLPFFYFSYSVLTGLRFSTVFPINLWSITACFIEAIAAKVFLIVFVARMAVSFVKNQMYS